MLHEWQQAVDKNVAVTVDCFDLLDAVEDSVVVVFDVGLPLLDRVHIEQDLRGFGVVAAVEAWGKTLPCFFTLDVDEHFGDALLDLHVCVAAQEVSDGCQTEN